MARKGSFFAGGSKSASFKHDKAIEYEVAEVLPPDVATVPEVDLHIEYQTIYRRKPGNPYRKDYSSLVQKYPHHECLIRQFLAAAPYALRPLQAPVSARYVYEAIEDFVSFLNDKRNLGNEKVLCIADISPTVAKSYVNFLASVFPRRTKNRKFYGSIKRLVNAMQTVYAGSPGVGRQLHWPPGPKNIESVLEGYTPEQMQELAIACMKDIREIKRLHRIYDSLTDESLMLDSATDLSRLTSQNQYKMLLATVKARYPEYPFNLPLAEARLFLSSARRASARWAMEHGDIALRKKLVEVTSSIGDIGLDGISGIDLVHSAMYFTEDTLYPFFLLVAINTGWNVESILAISDEVDNHANDDLFDPEDYKVLFSSKVRGAGKKGFSTVVHRTQFRKEFSTYNLLKYVQKVVVVCRNSPYYKDGQLWQFIPHMARGTRTMIHSFFETVMFNRTCAFVARHKFRYFSDNSVDHRRVRSGYATMREAGGLTEWEIGNDLDHEDPSGETASRHYTSDNSSNAIKDIVIKDIQQRLVYDMRNYEKRIVESKTLRELRAAIEDAKSEAERKACIRQLSTEIGIEEKTIVHLISPGAQKYIAACEDSKKPTWDGHEKLVPDGSNCRYFNKCCLCKQAVIFADSLPYICRRIFDLDQLKPPVLTPLDFISIYGDEYDAWQQILDRWNNRLQVAEAMEIARSGQVTLPKMMKGV